MSIYNYKIRFRIYSIYPVLTVPISSVSARIRDGSPSYLQVTVPDYYNYAYDISIRSAGSMYVYKSINNAAWQEILWVDIENIYTYLGAKSKSIVLSGHRTISFGGVPATVYASSCSYVGTTNKTIIRCGIENTPWPNDRVVSTPYYADITAETITYTVNNRQAIIEVSGT